MLSTVKPSELGKKGFESVLEFKNVPNEEKKDFGQAINTLKGWLCN
jgi:hypothetical protein